MILVAYDIEDKHVEFKAFLKKKGYSDMLGNANLPNTTLVKDGISTEQGREDLKAAATAVGTSLERGIAVDFNANTWNGIVGTPHK